MKLNLLDSIQRGNVLKILKQFKHSPWLLFNCGWNLSSYSPIGGVDLNALKSVCSNLDVRWVGESLSIKSEADRNFNLSFPIQRSQHQVNVVCEKIIRIQKVLPARLILGNPEKTINIDSKIDELEFTARILENVDCDFLIDFSSLFQFCKTQKFTPKEYIEVCSSKVRVLSLDEKSFEDDALGDLEVIFDRCNLEVVCAKVEILNRIDKKLEGSKLRKKVIERLGEF